MATAHKHYIAMETLPILIYKPRRPSPKNSSNLDVLDIASKLNQKCRNNVNIYILYIIIFRYI